MLLLLRMGQLCPDYINRTATTALLLLVTYFYPELLRANKSPAARRRWVVQALLGCTSGCSCCTCSWAALPAMFLDFQVSMDGFWSQHA